MISGRKTNELLHNDAPGKLIPRLTPGILMLLAILLMHTGDMFALTDHGGWRLELQGFYLLGALAIMFPGSGRHAVKPDSIRVHLKTSYKQDCAIVYMKAVWRTI